MSLSVISTVQSVAASSTSPIVLPSLNAIAVNLIVVATRLSKAGVTITGVSDTALNTYTPLTAVVNGAFILQIWYAKNILASAANIISIAASTVSGLTNFAACAWEIVGADQSSPLDQQAVGSNSGASPITSALFTTTLANEIIVSCGASNAANATPTWATNSGDVLDSSGFPAINNICGQQHRIVSSIQTNTVESMTFSNPATLALIAAASFKAANITPSSGNSAWITVDLNNGLRGLRH